MDLVSHRAEEGAGGEGPSRPRGEWLATVRRDPVAAVGSLFATVVLPFALVVYLALTNGGYDPIVRTEIGIVLWWAVLLGALVGVLPVSRVGRRGWLAIGLLAGLAAWTAVGLTWTESIERSFDEVARVVVYLGVLVLAIAVQGPEGLRRTVAAVGAAIGVVGVIALLSRFEPSLFPENHPAEFLPGAQERLNYPLNYWNGLAALMAVGIPLLLTVAAHSPGRLTRALATAGLPVLALTAFYTFSRAAIPALLVGLLTALALSRPRRATFAALVLGGLGSAIAIAVATQFDSLESGLDDSAAATGGDVMLGVIAAVAVTLALVRLAPKPAIDFERLPRPSRRASWATIAVAATAALVVAVAAGLPDEVSERWEEFKDPGSAGVGVERFASTSGAGRYQQWGAALDAFESEPLTGIGAGTYEFWWAREAPITAFVRDAHSLYLEVLAELGIVGLVLLAALLATLLTAGVRGALGPATGQGAYLGGVGAAIAAFAVAAAFDWDWELTVIPVAVLLVGGAACVREPAGAGEPGPLPGRSSWASRLPLAGLAVAAIILLGSSLLALNEIDASRDEARRGDLESALASARTARDRQPWSATAALQEALVLERLGRLDDAAAAAIDATEEEPTNWRTWLIVARIETLRGNAAEGIAAYREAASLNPRAPELAEAAESER